ncbi:MAG: TadE family protein [Elusimicrobiota bacterium]
MKKAGRSGQVMVEMLLILPVFLTIIFSIMEIGYISFQLILLNHATYEVARIGGMTTTSPPGHSCGKLDEIMKTIILSASVSCGTEKTLTDPQSQQDNSDLIITGSNKIKLIFPISSVILSQPRGMGTRLIQAVVRMPIESPLIK